MRLADGVAIEPEAVYTVTVTDFLATGAGDGFAAFGRALSSTPTGIVDLDALIRHVQNLPQPLRAPRDARMRTLDDDNRQLP
jgi:hypothetical protein